MQYNQTNQATESKLQWKPIKQLSYMDKLNNFAAYHNTDCLHHDHSHAHQHQHQHHQCWSPNQNQTSFGNAQQMNTWSEKKNTFGECQQYLQTQNQNMSEYHAHGYYKKPRNLSNEENKIMRYASEFGMNGEQVQQSHSKDFSQNQISVQNKSKDGCFTINLDKTQAFNANGYQNISSNSSKASTNDSDVEIIDDDYSKTLEPMSMGIKHYKSTLVDHQTTLDNRQQPIKLSKMYSTFSNLNCLDNIDEVSSFTGEATRQSQKKKFVNKEERFEFNQKIEKMKKTEMCRNIIMYGHCKYGSSCSYAHHQEELVPKQHLPSNYKTKLCSQYQQEGYCMYGQRCQFLHSIYDLSDKSNLSYQRGLAEEARLTWQRIQQGSDCIMVNILKGKGCVAPEQRLPCFEAIYNKQDYQAELQKKEQEKQQRYFPNSYGNYDRYVPQQNFNNSNKFFRKSEPWSNKVYANNSWEQGQYLDNGSGQFKTNYRRYQPYK